MFRIRMSFSGITTYRPSAQMDQPGSGHGTDPETAALQFCRITANPQAESLRVLCLNHLCLRTLVNVFELDLRLY